MSVLSDATWLYFTPSASTFWKWTADHEAVEWITGQTIGFRYELQTLIAGLAAEGLPPFENILLTVAACRNRSDAKLREARDLMKFQTYKMRFSMIEAFGNAVDRLIELAHLPEDLRTSFEGKLAILQLICENGPSRKEPEFSQHCVDWLNQGFSITPGAQSYTKTTHDWITELRGLYDGLAAVNEVAVRLRTKTGLSILPDAAPVPLELPSEPPEPAPLTIRQLLHALEQHEAYRGLARLTRRLLAVVTLPRPLLAQDLQPVGGVSDITNRGDFDRLLLSELANDSDILMTRVALHEALYIRRELPPSFPPRARCVLIDAGIRMWGLPRLYASAVALAFAVNHTESTTLQLFRSSVDDLIPIELTDRDKFIEHLASLDFSIHPGELLGGLFEEFSNTPAEVVIVTCDDVLADPDFQRCLGSHPFPNLYLAAVNRAGGYRLLQRTRQGERLLRQANLELDQILAEPAATKPKLIDTRVDPRLPAICRTEPFPLHLCHPVNWGSCSLIQAQITMNPERAPGAWSQALLQVTHDQRLTLWEIGSEIDPLQLTDRLPPGKLLWHSSGFESSTSGGLLQVVVGIPEQGELSLVSLFITADAPRIEIVPLELPPIPVATVAEHGGILYLTQVAGVTLVSLKTGQKLGVQPATGRSQEYGRFSWQTNEIYAISPEGQGFHRQLVAAAPADVTETLAVFDCAHLASPVVVRWDNSITLVGSVEPLQFLSRYVEPQLAPRSETRIGIQDHGVGSMQVAKIAPDGNRLALFEAVSPNSNRFRYGWLVDLEHLTATQYWNDAERILHSDVLNSTSRKSLRNRFSAIGTLDHHLVLKTTKGQLFGLYPADRPERIILKRLPIDEAALSSVVSFQTIRNHPKVGYTLRVAVWQNGSRAYLDSRGLLHLQMPDIQGNADRIPELTCVLYDQNVSGWCDRQLAWGETSIIGFSHARISPLKAFMDWLSPFCRQLL